MTQWAAIDTRHRSDLADALEGYDAVLRTVLHDKVSPAVAEVALTGMDRAG